MRQEDLKLEVYLSYIGKTLPQKKKKKKKKSAKK
jgi:hypothetical protein